MRTETKDMSRSHNGPIWKVRGIEAWECALRCSGMIISERSHAESASQENRGEGCAVRW